MWLTLDDLRCSQCGAFVHPLLDSCPGCGAAHPSWRREAAAGPIGAVRLVEAPEAQLIARDLTLRYTIRVNAIGDSTARATLVDAVACLADALTYRMTGDAVPITDNASLTLRDGSLIVQGRPSGTLLAEIPLPAIEGAAAGRGEVTLRYAAGLSAGATGRPASWADDAIPLRLTIANRRGLFASRARDDHFQAFARWTGVLAAAAAERRWMEIGLQAYLVELGLASRGPAGLAAATGDAPFAVPVTLPAAALPSPIQASLTELERLRAAGLVVDDEYAEKRREILARL